MTIQFRTYLRIYAHFVQFIAWFPISQEEEGKNATKN